MRLDQGSLIFKPLNGECPSWETALGQSHEGNGELPPYHFKAEGYENILKGLIFNSVPLNTVSCILGKTKEEVKADTSYLFTKTQEIQLAGKFEKVIVHFGDQEKSFVDAPFTLLLTKIQDGNKYHFGRRSIKYSPHTIADGVKNSDSFEKIQNRFGERLACYGLFVEHFDTLHLYCVSADTYYDKNNWKDFSLPETEWTDWVEWEKEERENNPPQVNHESAPNPIKSFTPSQIIYYGVPGCGKSKKIMDLLDVAKQRGEITDEEKQVVRVVFHPEYTNADFVGQVMPVVKPAGGVDYDFAAGPFARILARAYANPTKPYFLVIEEINRGNAAAIFGEIFQLLDRHKKGESDSVGGNTYTAGWSKYFVDHVDVNGKIREEIAGTEYSSDEEKSKITFTANTAIRLPPNLSIYATMNTSDQNVFTLDNAFKRRFDSELVRNTLDGDEHKLQRETKIEGTGVTWGTFWERINDEILNKNSTMSSSEDKRLGAYFIVGEEKSDDAGDKYREISRKLFGEKVLEYLWDDAFKYKRNAVFKDECNSVESLIENFEKGGFAAVFKSIDFTAASTRELEAPEK